MDNAAAELQSEAADPALLLRHQVIMQNPPLLKSSVLKAENPIACGFDFSSDQMGFICFEL